MQRKMKTKVLAWVLSLMMVVAFMPTLAFATDDVDASRGGDKNVTKVATATLPVAKEVIPFTGQSQRLVYAGTATAGHFEYATVGAEWIKTESKTEPNWSEFVPAESEPGTYTVLFRYVPKEGSEVPANCEKYTKNGDPGYGQFTCKIVKAEWKYGVKEDGGDVIEDALSLLGDSAFTAKLTDGENTYVSAEAVVSAAFDSYTGEGYEYDGAHIDTDREWKNAFDEDEIDVRYYNLGRILNIIPGVIELAKENDWVFDYLLVAFGRDLKDLGVSEDEIAAIKDDANASKEDVIKKYINLALTVGPKIEEETPTEAGIYVAEFVFNGKKIKKLFYIYPKKMEVKEEPAATTNVFDKKMHDLAGAGVAEGGHYEYAIAKEVKIKRKAKPADSETKGFIYRKDEIVTDSGLWDKTGYQLITDWSKEVPQAKDLGEYDVIYRLVPNNKNYYTGNYIKYLLGLIGIDYDDIKTVMNVLEKYTDVLSFTDYGQISDVVDKDAVDGVCHSAIYDDSLVWQLEQQGVTSRDTMFTDKYEKYVKAINLNDDQEFAPQTMKISVKEDTEYNGEEVVAEIKYSDEWKVENNLPVTDEVFYAKVGEDDDYVYEAGKDKDKEKKLKLAVFKAAIKAHTSNTDVEYAGDETMTPQEASDILQDYDEAPATPGKYVAIACVCQKSPNFRAEDDADYYWAKANFTIRMVCADITKAPEGVAVPYDSYYQELVKAGEVDGGHLEYAMFDKKELDKKVEEFKAEKLAEIEEFKANKEYKKHNVIKHTTYERGGKKVVGYYECVNKKDGFATSWDKVKFVENDDEDVLDIEGIGDKDNKDKSNLVLKQISENKAVEEVADMTWEEIYDELAEDLLENKWSKDIPKAKELGLYTIAYNVVADEYHHAYCDSAIDGYLYSVIYDGREDWSYREVKQETKDLISQIEARYDKTIFQSERDYDPQYITMTMDKDEFKYGEEVEVNVDVTEVWAAEDAQERGMAKIGNLIYKGTTADDEEYCSYAAPTEVGNYTASITIHAENTKGVKPHTCVASLDFEIVPNVLDEPEAVSVPYNGENQELVEAGTVEGAKYLYAIDDEDWSEEVPEAKEIGTYEVWYKIVSEDKGNEIVAAKSLTAEIFSDKEAWTYIENEAEAGNTVDTITALYEANDHKYLPQTLTLSVGASKFVYDGTPVEATVELTDVWGNETAKARGMELPLKVVYEGTGETNYKDIKAPSEVGTYKASVRLDSKKYIAEVSFEIVPNDSEVESVPVALTKVYNGGEQALVRKPIPRDGVKVEYYNYDAETPEWTEEVPTATNAGKYDIVCKITTKNKSYEFGLTAVILQKTLLIDWSKNNTFVYDGTQKDVANKYALIGLQDENDDVSLKIKEGKATDKGDYTAEVVVGTFIDSYLLGEDADNYILAPAAEKTYDWSIVHEHKFEYNRVDIDEKTDAVDVCCAGDDACAGGTADCDLEHARLFVEAPDVLYTGEEYTLAQIVKHNWDEYGLSQDISKICYKKYNKDSKDWEPLNRLPREAGTYIAFVSVGCHKPVKTVYAATQFDIVSNPAEATTEPSLLGGLVYNGEKQSLVEAGSCDPKNTIMYAVGTTDVNDKDAWSSEVPSAIDAGQYPIYWYVKGSKDNWTTDSEVHELGEATIDPKTVKLTWGQDVFVFDGYKHVVPVDVTGIVKGDAVTAKVKGAQSKVGTYKATAYGLNDPNYVLPAKCTKSFKIVKASLLAQATHRTKTTTKISWNKIPGADKYVIYGTKCNKNGKVNKFERITTVGAGYSYRVVKGLKKYVQYKFYVAAYRSGKLIAKSKIAHCITYNTNKKMKIANVKSITAVTKKITVKANGNPGGVVGVYKVYQNKKCLDSSHAKAYRYVTSNPYVAKVNSLGTVYGLHKGTCKVYIQAVNGLWCAVKVTVK